jgi:ectoine hydroxylase-related dioxygenase (phytanoyl-CoA dioxygenase family)
MGGFGKCPGACPEDLYCCFYGIKFASNDREQQKKIDSGQPARGPIQIFRLNSVPFIMNTDIPSAQTAANVSLSAADSAALRRDLTGHFALDAAQIAFFQENGYIKLKQVFQPATMEHYRREIAEQVRLLNTQHLPMEQRTTYQKAFLQIVNIWEKSDRVKEFSFAPKLARLAAELLGVSGVRMYHDQALYKEAGGGITPWHADQYYWPVSSDRTVTAWIPLQATPLEMGPLAFARKTHRMPFGRDLEISDESERMIQKSLKDAQADIDETPFDLGEVSFHLGWTFHRAGANRSDRPREVMTVIYVDENIRLIEPQTKAGEADRQRWCKGVEVGEVLDGPLNPVLWSSRA